MRGHTNVQCIIPPQISPVCHLIVTKQFISTILMFYLSSLLYEYWRAWNLTIIFHLYH